MGVGRRMQKQGPPEPLSEAHYAKLKRKAGIPVDDAPAEAPNKKKRRTSQDASKKKGAATKKAAKPKLNANTIPLGVSKGKNGKAKAKATEPDRDGEISDGLLDGFAHTVDEDEFSDLEDDGVGGLGDDFLDSDNSVYDSDEAHHKGMFSEDEDESDLEEKLTAANIAGLSRRLDLQLAEEEAEAQAELEEAALQTNIDGDRPHILDNDDEEEGTLAAKTKALLAPDLQLLRNRISDTVRVLGDFAKLSEEGRTRSEYTSQLLKDICAYYGYSEFLAEKLFNLFTPQEAYAFFEANETARPVVIRTNTLRTSRRELASALINRGVVLEPVGKWSKVGLQIFESNVPLGATPEYLAGQYILQAASSFLPVMALSPQEGERVLDMAAAPGGKTTHLAAMMKNKGCIFANDPSKSRAKGLIGNIHRLGARNVVVCNYDAREFPRVMGGFDRVLLDAPCSGTGVISKDPSVKTNKTEKDFMILPHTQRQLLLAAIDSVNHASNTGGFVVYSTCSVTVEENEQVVNYALSKRPNVKLVSTDLTFGKEGFVNYMGKQFDQSLRLTRRFYPHTTNMDGFFVAKFQKVGPSPVSAAASGKVASTKHEQEEVIDKTPIAADEKMGGMDDEFGGFDEDEDQGYIQRAQRNAMRRRGIDPNALHKKGKGRTDGKDGEKGEAKTTKENEAKTVANDVIKDAEKSEVKPNKKDEVKVAKKAAREDKVKAVKAAKQAAKEDELKPATKVEIKKVEVKKVEVMEAKTAEVKAPKKDEAKGAKTVEVKEVKTVKAKLPKKAKKNREM